MTEITRAVLPRFGPPRGVKPYSYFWWIDGVNVVVEHSTLARQGFPQGGNDHARMGVWVRQLSNPSYGCHGPPFIDQGVTTMAK